MLLGLVLCLGLVLTNSACTADVPNMELVYLKDVKGKIHEASEFRAIVLYKDAIISSSGQEVIRRELDSDKEEILFKEKNICIIDNLKNIFVFITNSFDIILFDMDARKELRRMNYLHDFKLELFNKETREYNFLIQQGLFLDENRLMLLLYNSELGDQELGIYDFVKKEKKIIATSINLHLLDVNKEEKIFLFRKDGRIGYKDEFVYVSDLENDTTREIMQYAMGYGFLYAEDTLVFIKNSMPSKKESEKTLVQLNFKGKPVEKVITIKDQFFGFRYYRDENKLIAGLKDKAGPSANIIHLYLYEVK